MKRLILAPLLLSLGLPVNEVKAANPAHTFCMEEANSYSGSAHFHDVYTDCLKNAPDNESLTSYEENINPKEKANELHDLSWIKFKQGDYLGAILDATKAIKILPNQHALHTSRGLFYQANEDWERSLNDYTIAIKIFPERSSAYYGRSSAKQELGDLNSALSDINKAIELAPLDNYVLVYDQELMLDRRAKIKEELKDYYGAIADYKRTIEITPKDNYFHRWAYFNMGTIKQLNLKDYSGAIADYNEALKLFTDSKWIAGLNKMKNIALNKLASQNRNTSVTTYNSPTKKNNKKGQRKGNGFAGKLIRGLAGAGGNNQSYPGPAQNQFQRQTQRNLNNQYQYNQRQNQQFKQQYQPGYKAPIQQPYRPYRSPGLYQPY